MAKTRSKFVYRGDKRTVEDVVRNSKRSGGAYDSFIAGEVQLLKLKEGESTLRIMPPSWDEKDDAKWGTGWHIEVMLHYGVGPDNATYLCLDKMLGEKCPICEARRDATDDERDQLKPQSRFLCWVIDRDNEKAGPQVWSMPITVFRDINLKSVDKKHNTPIPIDDPENGYDVFMIKEGTGLKTKYKVDEVSRDGSPLADDERLQDRWLDYISEHPLPDVLNYYDAEHIEKVLFGKSERGGEDDEEAEEKPRGGRGRGASARRGKSSDDEQDYLEEEETEEEEERGDKKPARGRGRGKSHDEEPEEEPEETEEEEEVEERPRGRGSRSSGSSRRRSEPEPEEEEESEEEEEPEEDETSTSRAKRKLGDMQRRRSRR